MAMPAENNGANIGGSSTSVAAPSRANCLRYLNPGIYIKDHGECLLFKVWFTLPHPGIHIAAVLERNTGLPRPVTAAEAAYVSAKITSEQDKRFALYAQSFDIELALGKLQRFKDEMVEIRGVLEADLEDEMADFDKEEFKRMENL